MSENKIELSVIIAAFNEENIIERNLQRIIAELSCRPSVVWEIVCVDDGSKDQTGMVLDKLAREETRLKIIHHRRNFGQGRALKTAFDVSRGDIFVTLDADLSYGPEYIFQLFDALNENNADIVLASPYMKGGMVKNVPFYRHFLSRYGNLYLGKMAGHNIATSTCVVRAYRKDVIDSLALNSDGMELLIEILNKARLMGHRILEIPAKLEWEELKTTNEGGKKRVSKMKITHTIQQYLMMGWLTRPAMIFFLFSFFLILPGGYMAIFIAYRVISEIVTRTRIEGIVWAISNGLNEVFLTYTYSIVISVSLLMIGLFLFAFSLLLIQNQYYYEETMKLLMHQKQRQ